MKKICLTGGGTAGHIMPNLALVPELKKRNYEIIYIGSKNGMEKNVIESNNITFFGITTDKLRRYIDKRNLVMPFNVIKGISEAKKILKKNKIDIVFSKGGYVALPVVVAAHSLKIPVISHEADYSLGLANKLAAPFSKKVCCNFEETVKYIGKKGIFTGCPIRNELLKGDKSKGLKLLGFTDNKPVLLITGGSLGAKYINDLIKKNINELLKRYNIVHICGKGKIDNNLNNITGYRQYEIISDNLSNIFAVSDFVISRAGANAIFELLALKKPNLLIPLSTKASRGDQILNANSFMKKGYSLVLLEEDQDKNNNLFFNKLNELTNNKDKFIKTMKNSIEINAIDNICNIIDEHVNND